MPDRSDQQSSPTHSGPADAPAALSHSSDPTLINAYCTVGALPGLDFPHQLHRRRDAADPELAQHLQGFAQYVGKCGDRELDQARYHLIRHVQRVRHHLSFTLAPAPGIIDPAAAVSPGGARAAGAASALAAWAGRANAVLVLHDGSVCDGSFRLLLRRDGTADPQARLPYPVDALARKAANQASLRVRGVPVSSQLPPVLSELEVEPRPPADVARRALALLIVAVHGEALATARVLPVELLQKMRPLGFASLSPAEQDFLAAAAPPKKQAVHFAWRYEALATLQWALGLDDELPFPDRNCDVPKAAQIMFDVDEATLIKEARLRPTADLLNALDLHYRCHWSVRDAKTRGLRAPADFDPGVVQERHHTLNWLLPVGNPGVEWDDVRTPT